MRRGSRVAAWLAVLQGALLLAAVGGAVAPRALRQTQQTQQSHKSAEPETTHSDETIHVVFSSHFDVGFTRELQNGLWQWLVGSG